MPDIRTLVSAEVHEPKYISDTTATDAGKVITPLSGGTSEIRFLTPQEVGLNQYYAEMQALEVPDTEAINLTAATDSELYTDTDYINISSARISTFTLDQANGVTFNSVNNTLVVPAAGDYRISGWFNISSDTANTKIGLRYTANGSVAGATIKSDIKDVDRVNNINGFGFVTLAADDEVGIAIAADKTSSIHIRDCVVMIDLIRET